MKMKMNENQRRALKRIEEYCNMNQWGSEVELGIRHDVERGTFPRSWYVRMKELKWNPQVFKEEFLKEFNDGDSNKNDQRSSGDGENTPSDLPDP